MCGTCHFWSCRSTKYKVNIYTTTATNAHITCTTQLFMYTYSAAITMGAVHHHLINKKLRMSAAVVVETGEAR